MNATLLQLLRDAGGDYLSGEVIAAKLAISRAAVWKQITALREKGYGIEAVTRRGYRLVSEPEPLDPEAIRALLEGHPWAPLVQVFDVIGSTNDQAKRLGAEGAPHGTVLIADEQTGGRGRQGRSFQSPKGKGLYYSALLRPECAPQEVSHVTAMTAVAVCDAIEAAAGVRPGIKWTNDIILGGKKIVGILTEMSAEWESNRLQYLVIGIGINCNHTAEDFPPEILDMAASISMITGRHVDRCLLAAELTKALLRVSREILSGKDAWLAQYRKDCVTLGREIRILRGSNVRLGTALDIDENGGLLVRYDSGEEGLVYSGEVSVRGLCGYV